MKEIKEKERKSEEEEKMREEKMKQLDILRKEMFQDFIPGGDSMEFKNISKNPLDKWKNIRIKLRKEYNYEYLLCSFCVLPYELFFQNLQNLFHQFSNQHEQ